MAFLHQRLSRLLVVGPDPSSLVQAVLCTVGVHTVMVFRTVYGWRCVYLWREVVCPRLTGDSVHYVKGG